MAFLREAGGESGFAAGFGHRGGRGAEAWYELAQRLAPPHL
jgi:hypothetical protein